MTVAKYLVECYLPAPKPFMDASIILAPYLCAITLFQTAVPKLL